MQKSIQVGGARPSGLSNPLFDILIASLKAQTKAWQTYHLEGTLFFAKRMRCDLEQLRALGRCCDFQSTAECQLAWLREMQKDYAEECGRLAATTFAIGFGDIAGLGWLLGRRTVQGSTEHQPVSPPTGELRSEGSLQAAA